MGWVSIKGRKKVMLITFAVHFLHSHNSITLHPVLFAVRRVPSFSFPPSTSNPVMAEQNNADNPPKSNTASDPGAAQTATRHGQQPSPNSPDHSMCAIATKYRYEVTAMSLIGLALGVCLLQTFATSSYCVLRLLVMPIAVLFTLFGAEWVHYFSDGLTHRKQAYFDVKNILETYQPRSYTEESLLFQPDPPTPDVGISAPKNVVDTTVPPAGQPSEGFEKWRKSHYEGEYARAMEAVANAPPIYTGMEEAVTQGQQQMVDQKAANEEATEQKPEQQGATTDQRQQNPAADGQASGEQQNPADEQTQAAKGEGQDKPDDATKNE